MSFLASRLELCLFLAFRMLPGWVRDLAPGEGKPSEISGCTRPTRVPVGEDMGISAAWGKVVTLWSSKDDMDKIFTRDGRPAPPRTVGKGGFPAPPPKNDQNRGEVAGQNKGPNLNFLH